MAIPGKLLALDVGNARIGAATCDPLGLTVRPLGVIERRNRRADVDEVVRLLRQEEAEAVLCGLPLNMDGSEGEQARQIRAWARHLARALRAIFGRPLPVIFWDERLSTYVAQELAEQEGTLWSNAAEDAVAAAVILRSYLDAQRRGTAADYGRIDLPPRTE